MKNDTSNQQPGNGRHEMGLISLLKGVLSPEPLRESELYKKLEDSITTDSKRMYVGELLKRAAQNFPNNTVLIYKGRSITYKELYYRSVNFSKKLQGLGIEKNDRVLMCFENSIDFYVVYFGILQIGAICVPLNTFLHAKELKYIIDDANPKGIVASSKLKANFESYTNDKLFLLSSDDIDYESDVPSQVEEFEVQKLNDDETCLLLYTSGTTGVPKGVMLSSSNIMVNTLQCSARFGRMIKFIEHSSGVLEGPEKFFAALPLFHVFAQNACIWFPMIMGASIIVVPKIDRRDILEGLASQPTIFLGVPALYGLLCLLKTAPLDSVKFFISGGDSMPDKIRAAFSLVYGRKVCAGYGLTEASPVVAINIDNHQQETHVVGEPMIGIKCEIRSDDGVILDHGEVGTLWVKGDNVMLGYYKSPEETAKVINNGWLNTGDLATVDENGNLAIIGRSKDLIIHKGFNIYPQEVENVLLSHPSVFKAAVIGKEDMISGQVPVAYIALKVESPDAERSLRKFCMERLATYKIPKKFVCLDDLPMNATGKVDKKSLDGTN